MFGFCPFIFIWNGIFCYEELTGSLVFYLIVFFSLLGCFLYFSFSYFRVIPIVFSYGCLGFPYTIFWVGFIYFLTVLFNYTYSLYFGWIYLPISHHSYVMVSCGLHFSTISLFLLFILLCGMVIGFIPFPIFWSGYLLEN